MLDKFDEYMLDLLIESVKNDETNLMLSERLYDLLRTINHPIAKKLIDNDMNDNKSFKVTLLDINDKHDINGNPILDSISFMTSNKAIEIVSKELEFDNKKELSEDDKYKIYKYFKKETLFNVKGRSETSLGRIINKLFPNEFDPNKEIEPFVNLYKSNRDISDFELVSGDDIIFWYNEDNYAKGGTLNSSCMRHSYCSEYLKFYSTNEDKISLLILRDKDDKNLIRGRAIVWNLDTPSGRTFMDRIYYTSDYIINLFKEYAIRYGWLHKKEQNMDATEDIIDTITKEKYDGSLVVEGLGDPGSGCYPYMDTIKYFDRSWASNEEDEVDGNGSPLVLTNTDGTADNDDENGTWSDYFGEYIDTDSGDYCWCERSDDYRYDDDCFYSEEYGETIANDYAERNGTWCDHCDDSGDSWREDGDFITLSNGDTSTKEYADDNFYYSEYSNEWCEDAHYSDYHGTYIDADNSVEVYTDVEKSGTDYRADNDDSWWTWDYDDEKYSNEVKEKDLKEYNGLLKKRNMVKHTRKKLSKE